MRLITAAHPDDPAFDMALSHALLRGVAEGDAAPVARVFRPGATMAFGRLDALRPGFAAARAAAARHGFAPVLRLGGGHAAAYDRGAVVVELVTREASVTAGVQEGFAAGTAVLVDALCRAGLDPEVGERPGEYCPGRWSIHAAGGPKLAGAAQRRVRGAALFTAVVVAEGGDRLRDALVDVYAALGLAWDPRTAGAADDVLPGLRADDVEQAVLDALAARAGPLTPVALPAAIAARAGRLVRDHRPG